MILCKYIDTPVGKMRLAATDEGICLFDFQYRKSIDAIVNRVETSLNDRFEEGEHPHFAKLEAQIGEYFNGTRQEFDLPLHLVGTPFQKSVWEGLLQIPYAIRAVASANGENGIAIIVPCHRVIGTNGSLVGYGGGLQRKKWLLEHERKHSGKTGQGELFA